MNRYGFIKVAAAIPEVSVANCDHNAERIISLMQQAAERGVEVVVFPELSITGSTCGDLYRQPTLLTAAEQALCRIARASQSLSTVAIVGLPARYGQGVYNCAAVVADGKVVGLVPKQNLSVTQKRWFHQGNAIDQGYMELSTKEVAYFGCDQLFEVGGIKFGVEIGADIQLPTPPSTAMSLAGAKMIFNLSAEAEIIGTNSYLSQIVRHHSMHTQSAYVLSSAGFGESTTDVAYAGNAFVAECGILLAQAKRFSLTEQLVVSDIDTELVQNNRQPNDYSSEDYIVNPIDINPSFELRLDRSIDPSPFTPSDKQECDSRCEEVFAIQSMALVKRLKHTQCRTAVVGISGGLDSTLALLVAVGAFDMLGLDRKGIIGITMPGFGTTDRTYNNALTMIRELGVTLREISIAEACRQHFKDIGLADDDRSVTYENAQARERTQILMDVANMNGGMVIGTGDLSELTLGWATYNGDQMSMYGVNASVPKTLIRHIVTWYALRQEEPIRSTLLDVVATPVSPELLPANEQGDIAQKTEDLVGPYELHDFFLYHFIRNKFSPSKILYLAECAFCNRYDRATITHWLRTFFRRFFAQQFKRSAMPDGPKVGSVSLSPRGDWMMPSDAASAMWLAECDKL